jgi:hypothetical protein
MTLRNTTLIASLALAPACVVGAPQGDEAAADDSSTVDPGDSSSGNASGSTAAADDSTTSAAAENSGSSESGAGSTGEVPDGCEAIIGDGLTVHDSTVGDETWPAGRHLVQGTIDVEGELVVSPCAIVAMDPDAAIVVANSGSLRMEGTADQPILVTSSKADPAPGDWREIDFYESSTDGDNVLRFVTIEYGGSAGYGQIWIDGGASVEIADATIRASADVGIYGEHGAALRSFVDNVLTENVGGPLRVGANTVGQLGLGTYSGNGIDGIIVSSQDVADDATWLALGVDYLAEDGFGITTEAGSANLTIAAGVTLALGPDAIITVGAHGGLNLAGTADERVTIRSSKQPPAAGDWREIDIYATSNGPANRFEHADIAHGGGAGYGQVWLDGQAQLTVDDVAFSDGLDCDVSGSGTVIANATTWVDCP